MANQINYIRQLELFCLLYAQLTRVTPQFFNKRKKATLDK